ncbi:MAG: ArsR family transcriptional regulator [Micropruina sp.]
MDVLLAHQALGDEGRLKIAQVLLTRDLAPGEIAEHWGLSTPLVAHHLNVLADSGLVIRRRGEHDGRKSYIALHHDDPEAVALVRVGAPATVPPGRVMFVCTRNSARSKLAAAWWRRISDVPALDAGTAPASAPHPLALRTASRHGLAVDRTMRDVGDTVRSDDLVIAVCDHVHETLPTRLPRWHWSIPDPVAAASSGSFDHACRTIGVRVRELHRALGSGRPGPHPPHGERTTT